MMNDEEFAIWDKIIAEAAAMGWIDWTVTATALLYVWLSARNNVWCWFWGIISCSLWAYASFVMYRLYSDALLQLFYVAIAFLGLYQWRRGGRERTALPITRMQPREHAIVIGASAILALLLGYLFERYSAAAAPYWDAYTTTFSVATTFLLVRRKLENWLYWIVIDLAYAGLYYSRGAYLFALLMVTYTIIAVFAWKNWRRLATI